jgi:hypothetical protein
MPYSKQYIQSNWVKSSVQLPILIPEHLLGTARDEAADEWKVEGIICKESD